MAAVKIDPEAFNADDIAELEVMVLAAAKDAQNRVIDAQEKMSSSVTGGMKIPGLF
jgi:DNA-binding protein YbaB